MENNTIKTYKGFDKDMTCQEFRYEEGKEYEHDGDVRACESGFHACENPMDILGYYPPCDNKGNLQRYCEVKQSGTLDRSENDKVCSSQLRVVAEIGLNGLIKAGVRFILDKVNFKDAKESNTGDWSAATNTGDQSAATNTGNWSAATNTGNQSAATNTGNQSAATNTGDRSAATVEGEESIAVVTGYGGKAKGALGCWIVLTERDGNGHILGVKAVKVDGEAVKPDRWYMLKDGEITECND